MAIQNRILEVSVLIVVGEEIAFDSGFSKQLLSPQDLLKTHLLSLKGC